MPHTCIFQHNYDYNSTSKILHFDLYDLLPAFVGGNVKKKKNCFIVIEMILCLPAIVRLGPSDLLLSMKAHIMVASTIHSYAHVLEDRKDESSYNCGNTDNPSANMGNVEKF